MQYQDDEEYRRWHLFGRLRGWFKHAPDRDAEQFRRDSMYEHTREENRPYGYMYGSQTFGHEGPIDRWRLGGTEFGAYGTRPVDQLKRGRHYGRGPRNYQRNDEQIREDIIERLVRNHEIDATDVEVSVSGGEVTLKGLVASRYEKRLAEDICEDTFGVKSVRSELHVREEQPRITGGVSGNNR